MGIVLLDPEAIKRAQLVRQYDDLDISESNYDLEQHVLNHDNIAEVTNDGQLPDNNNDNTEYTHVDSVAAWTIAWFQYFVKHEGAQQGYYFLNRLHSHVKGEKLQEDELRDAVAGFAPTDVSNWDKIVTSKTAKDHLKKVSLYVVDRGMTSTPVCLFNGLMFKGKSARDSFFEGMQKEQPYIRELIRDGILHDNQKDIYKSILDHTKAGGRYNGKVFSDHSFVVFPVKMQEKLGVVRFIYPPSFDYDTAADLTQILIVDPTNNLALPLIIQVLRQLTSSKLGGHSSVRVGFVFVTGGGGGSSNAATVLANAFMALQAAVTSSSDSINKQQKNAADTLLQFAILVHKAISVVTAGKAAAGGGGGLTSQQAVHIVEAAMAALTTVNNQQQQQDDDDASPYSKATKLKVDFSASLWNQRWNSGKGGPELKEQSVFFEEFSRHVGVSGSDCALWLNGRKIVISSAGQLLAEDISLLQQHELQQRVTEVKDALTRHGFPLSGGGATHLRQISTAISGIGSVLANDWFKNGERLPNTPQRIEGKQSYGFGLSPTEKHSSSGAAMIDIVVILNPLSYEAQKLTQFLLSTHAAFSSHISVYFNPHNQISELPLKSFYRYVLRHELRFDENHGTILPPTAYFTNLPTTLTLTLGIDEPESWIVMSKYAVYDLDNIKLETLGEKKTLYAEYQLEHIVVTGSCVDVSQGQPPRGLELLMHNDVSPVDTVDTLVMSNYGYFQLKGTPGVWRIGLKPGSRGARIFDIASQVSIDTTTTSLTQDYQRTEVANAVLHTFAGEYIYLKVKRKKGMEEAELLAEGDGDLDSPLDQVWSTLGSFMGGDKKKKDSGSTVDSSRRPVTLNIFSVCSGHLYERLLKIMVHTVLNHTKTNPENRVRFWFLKNFLSPGFKQFLPHYAEKWGFDYELVTYKWPNWLHKQTEKQRIIWAYKILFLDVLFPLSLDKVIFVDADQIVKADLHELYNLDLQGAPLAYTPFCDSRKETEGFRFWKQGFWMDHLRGRPYHISAIYVVDIKKLRQQAAGDNLRMIYDNLSQDPNSLANLDQDLPNYTQHVVQIHSLPLEWLWCETWCDDESKARAKTIDLCNNPLTKVPKLDAARRIVPEWNDYDQTVSDFEESLGLPKW
eukprot:TRINITY_DN67984_c2_g6_i1.p1 TRINITY_DN67984_c2_g6~~TRINITY_DN67984_c2_g6_i1.p1  ORF type:complete len:1129 (-),score=117.80 TRINITY_DN67984_c2_g6_i1:1176-4562(-)